MARQGRVRYASVKACDELPSTHTKKLGVAMHASNPGAVWGTEDCWGLLTASLPCVEGVREQ